MYGNISLQKEGNEKNFTKFEDIKETKALRRGFFF